MNSPVNQIIKNMNDITKLGEANAVMIKTLLDFFGAGEKEKEFQFVYAKNYAVMLGIDITTNTSAGNPTLTKYSRNEETRRWKLTATKPQEGEKENEVTDSEKIS